MKNPIRQISLIFVIAQIFVFGVTDGSATTIRMTLNGSIIDQGRLFEQDFDTDLDQSYAIGDLISMSATFDPSKYKIEEITFSISLSHILGSFVIDSSSGASIEGVDGGELQILPGVVHINREKGFSGLFQPRGESEVDAPTVFSSGSGLFEQDLEIRHVRFGGKYEIDGSDPLALHKLINIPLESFFLDETYAPQPEYVELSFYDYYWMFGRVRTVRVNVDSYSFQSVPDSGGMTP